jgi:hypothetical protein
MSSLDSDLIAEAKVKDAIIITCDKHFPQFWHKEGNYRLIWIRRAGKNARGKRRWQEDAVIGAVRVLLRQPGAMFCIYKKDTRLYLPNGRPPIEL